MRKPSAAKRFRQHFRVGHDLPRVVPEFRLHRFQKADRLGRDDVDQRAALHPGKHDLVDGGGKFLLAQDHAGARSAQSLVRGRGDDVRMRHGRRMHASGNQSGEMRHVDQVERADFVGDLPHAGKIDDARIGAAPADDQLRTLLLGQLLQFVVVDGFGFFGHAVRNDACRSCRKNSDDGRA